MLTQPWRIEFFGGFRLRCGELEITRFRTRQTRALLALLAYHPRRDFSREMLIDLIWSDDASPPRKDGSDPVREKLRQALASLRRQLEPPGTIANSVLIAENNRLRLHSGAFFSDVAEFRQALAAAEESQELHEQIALLETAIGLYAGEFLFGDTAAWILPERDELANAHLAAFRKIIQCLEQARHFENALHYASRLFALSPSQSGAHRIMLLYEALGRPQSALAQFADLERRMSPRLPDAKIREVADRIAAASIANVDPAPTSSSAVLSGNSSKASPMGQIPPTLTRLIGRESELAVVTHSLSQCECRVLTLTGMGGAGKTHLASEVCRKCQQAFPGGVWFVPLADVSQALNLSQAIRDRLGLAHDFPGDPSDQISDWLRDREPTMLALDNAEHLLDAVTHHVQEWLYHAPSLTVLITSRCALNIGSEQEFRLAPLPFPSGSGTPDQMLTFSSVQLFVDRARAKRPDFQINAQNADAIAALCRRLDGLPLAILLAAAWIRTKTPQEMLQDLSRRFDLLVSSRPDLPDRHRSLRAALETSYCQLSPQTQRFFAQLSAFRGGWTAEAATAVCEEPQAQEQIAQLEAVALLLAEEQETGMRYRFLESIHDFAAELLPQSEHAHTAQRHIAYFLALAQQAKDHEQGPEQTQWLDRLEVEHDNLRAAFAFSLTLPKSFPFCLPLVGALQRFWIIRGHVREAQIQLAAALEWAEGQPATRDWLVAVNGAGILAWMQGDYLTARKYFERALKYEREASDSEALTKTLGNLGLVAWHEGDLAAARALIEESMELERALNLWGNVSESLLNLGGLAQEQGDFISAQQWLKEGLALFRKQGQTYGTAGALVNLAALAREQGDVSTARDHTAECLALCSELADPRLSAYALQEAALLAQSSHQDRAAAQLIGAADALRASIGVESSSHDGLRRDQLLERLRYELGESDFSKVYQDGMQRKQEEAIVMARAWLA